MAIESRRGRPYYYRKARRGGRVVSEYVGGGALGALAARLDRGLRDRKVADGAAWRAERSRLDALDRAVVDHGRRIEALAGEALLAAGYRRHHRGAWRKRRMATEIRVSIRPDERHLIPDLERARKGDAEAAARVAEACRGRPGQLVRVGLGDAARLVEQLMTVALAGADEAQRLATQARFRELCRELAGPDPAPLERLLAERAALCWLTVHQYEAAYAQRMGELSIAQGDFHQRRIDAAHRRYLSALKSLAAVRRLALPAVRINLARRQVNVAGGPALCPPESADGGEAS